MKRDGMEGRFVPAFGLVALMTRLVRRGGANLRGGRATALRWLRVVEGLVMGGLCVVMAVTMNGRCSFTKGSQGGGCERFVA